ncbi:hypothetical protein Lser_V15G03880 [Lactuca serriola]
MMNSSRPAIIPLLENGIVVQYGAWTLNEGGFQKIFNGVVVGNDATGIINDTPLESASGKVTYAHCEIEKVIYGDMVAAENDKPEDVVVVDISLKDTVTDEALMSSSRKLKDDVQYQNENNVSEDIIVAGNETHIGVDDDRFWQIVND